MAGSYAVAYLCQCNSLPASPSPPALLVAPSAQLQPVRRHLAEAGFRPSEPQTDRFAFTRHCYQHTTTGLTLRIAFDTLETDVATIPVADRLSLDGLTLPPCELLLTRLGWSTAVDRYLQEAECLLERFEVVGHDEVEGINGYSFAMRARSSASLETTVTRWLDAVLSRHEPETPVFERIQLLKVWMKCARGLTAPRSAQLRTLYRNWMYPTSWM
jgi:hypothetical protein